MQTFFESPSGKLYLKQLLFDGTRFSISSYSSDGLKVDDLTGWKVHGYAVAILGEPDQGSRNIEWNDGRPLRV